MIPPLHGIRVLAVEQYGAGPWASMYLADMGAEVIKIEDPSTGMRRASQARIFLVRRIRSSTRPSTLARNPWPLICARPKAAPCWNG